EFEQQQDQQSIPEQYPVGQTKELGQQSVDQQQSINKRAIGQHSTNNQEPNFEHRHELSYGQKLEEIEKFQQDSTQGFRNLVGKGVWNSSTEEGDGDKAD